MSKIKKKTQFRNPALSLWLGSICKNRGGWNKKEDTVNNSVYRKDIPMCSAQNS